MPPDKTPAILPRPEYPRPQFVRSEWLCLNGVWEFEIDRSDSGIERGFLDRPLAGEILIPFCPESKLSGVSERDFMEAVWYRREVRIPPAFVGRRLLMHFQAVDHDATVWANGEEVVRHRGGFTPFTADLGVATRANEPVTIVVRARDPRSGPQARGKQSPFSENVSAFYTRTTGIWQTVWLEPVPETYLQRPRITPDLSHGAFHVEVSFRGPRRGFTLRADLLDATGVIASAECRVDRDPVARLMLSIPEDRRRLWAVNDPFLYDLSLELVDEGGRIVDQARSYAGLRSITIDGKAILLNSTPLFQRLVADQGYYPEGVMTAPTEQALIRDIELAQAAGFNGARLHQKVFEERFLYHCDRLGYLVWSEFADWGSFDGTTIGVHPTASYITQWLEVLERDYSHPSVVGWCPLNETLQPLDDRITTLDDVTRGMFLATKAFDQTRPVIDVSGFSHRVRESDVYDSHNYEQDPTKFATALAGIAEGRPFVSGDPSDSALVLVGELVGPWSIPYDGQPYFVSEFGGILWSAELSEEEILDGYLTDPERRSEELEYWSMRLARSPEDVCARFEGLVAAQLENQHLFGYCYFQLYDTYQERLGIYHFDRSAKFDVARIRAIQSRPAAMEATDAQGE
jgi:beta-galactosidase/beta-glucuronidase